MEDKKGTTEETSAPPLPSENDAKATTEAATAASTETPAEPMPVSSENESVSAEKEAKAPEGATESKDAPAPQSKPETETASATSPSTPRGSSRRNSGVSGIANRVHRHETRSGTEGRLPSRFSDYEVSSPRQTAQGRVSRQRSSESKKTNATPAPATPTDAKKEQKEAPAQDPLEKVEVVKAVVERAVDPADELEMMLMSRGVVSVEPPAKKSREDASAADSTDSAAAKKSGGDKSPSTGKKSKSKRKSLVEGREARVVKRKFSLEQEMGLPDELQKCLALLNNMFRQDECSPFYYAVDPIRLNIPDYFEVIKKPMDMSKIKENLLSGSYKDAKGFTDDVHLMFENARTYNPAGHPVHILADRLEKSFQEQMSKIHSRRSVQSPAPVSATNSSSQLTATKSSSRLSLSGSRKSRSSQGRGSSGSSSSSSSSYNSSDSDSSDSSDDGHKKRKGRHHGKHHHHHHHHGKKGDRGHGKKRSHSSISAANELASVEESIRRAELEKLQNEVRLLKSQLLEQKQNKAKAASVARAEKAALAAAKRANKPAPKRLPLSFDTTPDPDRPVTEEDKRRISGNINRLPPERMVPLVSFVQDQIPALTLVVPGRIPMMPSEIEVDLDTLDNRTLRTVDHKVRQALALAGQARRRAERRLLEMQMHKEQQQRHHTITVEQQRAVHAKSLYQPQILTPQQTAMSYMDSLSRVKMQQDMSPMSSPSATQGYGDGSLPGTPGAGRNGGHSDLEDDEAIDGPEEEEAGEAEIQPAMASDSDSSSSSSSSLDSEADDDVPGTFVPPPLAPGSASGPVSLSQATAAAAAASSSAP